MLRTNLITTVLLIILFLESDVVYTQTATNEQISQLMIVMKAEEQFVSSMESMVELQKDNPQTAMLPEGFYPELIKDAKAGFKTDLLPKMVEIYKNNLTASEVDNLIAFYNTDLGKVMLNKMPIIQAEAANAGMLWGQQLGMEVAQRLMSKE